MLSVTCNSLGAASCICDSKGHGPSSISCTKSNSVLNAVIACMGLPAVSVLPQPPFSSISPAVMLTCNVIHITKCTGCKPYFSRWATTSLSNLELMQNTHNACCCATNIKFSAAWRWLHLQNSWILRGFTHRSTLIGGMNTARPRQNSLSCCATQSAHLLQCSCNTKCRCCCVQMQTCVLPKPVAWQGPAPAVLVLVQHPELLGNMLALRQQPWFQGLP